MFDLTDKVALVTGAGSGIGRAIAQRFARAGAVVHVGDLNEAGGAETVQLIAAAGGKAEFVRLDVADVASVAAVAAKIGNLDILVNNAGIGHVGTILQTEVMDMDRLYRVNVLGVFNVTKAFIPAMIARRRGSIINIASIGGIVGVRDRFAYVTTKFAVVGMTKQIALDHSAEGVRCNCICPGRVETPFVQARIKEYPDPEKAYQEMSATQLIGRMGQPGEIAAAAHYLASDDAALVTGASLMADGGWSVGK
ncbi:MAG: glucose 1-dehydrogenase [Cephaloticoccus sp.]|nr:glucose 1-dehydrogenase [Cephaloticoccus sp.]MCF7759237.1 glucose 1-dehydrogenase [Cephaloticoccus sp.]